MSVLASPEYVSAGSRMTWTGQFGSFMVPNSSWVLPQSANDVIAAVASKLQNAFQLAVERSENNVSALGLGSGSITLYLRTDSDRGNGETDDGLTDILTNVNDAFKQVGYDVVGSSIGSYTPAPAPNGAVQPTITTGTPLQTVTQQNANSPVSTGSWWDGLVSKVETGSVGFILGGVAVIVIILVVVVKSEV